GEPLPTFINYAEPEALVGDLTGLAAYKQHAGSLAGIPYNQVEPENSARWLFPRIGEGGKWPAYNLGKFIFHRVRGELTFRVGLNVERGLGPSAVETFESKSRAKLHVMSTAWRWHSFLEDFERGAVEPALNRISACVGSAA